MGHGLWPKPALYCSYVFNSFSELKIPEIHLRF
jgi:hypothetical protein